MTVPHVIAIDGPAASGKSTAARNTARALGYCHLNSGYLYRALTWAALEQGWIDDAERFEERVADLALELVAEPPRYRIRVGDREPGRRLASPAVDVRVSELAARAPARAKVLEILRREAARRSVVCDGRDIGTVVFPDAGLKVYLVASVEERARRRLGEHDIDADEREIRREAERLRARDEADAGRTLAPLRKAEDAFEIDTTRKRPEEVAAEIVALAREV